MSQKAEKELTQSRHYRNEPKGRRVHSLQTNIQAECWEMVTQYLFSCMLLTLQIYSRRVYHSTDLVPMLNSIKTETAIARREAGGGACACIYCERDED